MNERFQQYFFFSLGILNWELIRIEFTAGMFLAVAIAIVIGTNIVTNKPKTQKDAQNMSFAKRREYGKS